MTGYTQKQQKKLEFYHDRVSSACWVLILYNLKILQRKLMNGGGGGAMSVNCGKDNEYDK